MSQRFLQSHGLLKTLQMKKSEGDVARELCAQACAECPQIAGVKPPHMLVDMD